MWKEVQQTRKKEVLSSHFVVSSHVRYSRQSRPLKLTHMLRKAKWIETKTFP